MIKLLNFIKNHKFCALLISIPIFIIPLILVHIFYTLDIGIEWLQAKWSAGEILAYIAGFEAFIGTVSLGFLALYQNHKIQVEHIENQEPLLSMNLISDDGMLYLIVTNNGQTAAININIDVLEIFNNGCNNKLDLDGLFYTPFQLYPNEKVKGRVAISGNILGEQFFPQIKLKVSYMRSDLKRTREYERTVI